METVLPAPRDTLLNVATVATTSPNCLGDVLRSLSLASAGAVYPTANLAIFLPFIVETAMVATKLWWQNSGTLSGNVDMGLYDEAGTRLVSTGSTAMAGSNALQSVDTTDVNLSPGQRYYFGFVMDNGVGAPFRFAPAAGICQAMGVLQQATAFPLATNASPATFAKCATGYIPYLGLATRSAF